MFNDITGEMPRGHLSQFREGLISIFEFQGGFIDINLSIGSAHLEGKTPCVGLEYSFLMPEIDTGKEFM